VHNFFVTFIEVLDDEQPEFEPVEGVGSSAVSAGDFLFGFLEGTRRALTEKGRRSLTITVRRCDARAIGMLIALFERTVGFYASIVNINAYHQPGVEAGKRAATELLALQARVLDALRAKSKPTSASEIAAMLSADEGTVWRILRRLSANAHRGVCVVDGEGLATRYDVRRM
jgi:glucose-6-phosphate isomerase